MNMLRTLQIADAAFLLGCSLCVIVFLQRDYHAAPAPIRATVGLFGALAFIQAMWLLGIWLPAASGFPWPRAMLDGSLFSASIVRLSYSTNRKGFHHA